MSAHTFDIAGLDHCPFMPVFGAPAISIERGQGTEVWDTDGKHYLDFLSGIAVVSLGHANPVIAEAIARQAAHACCTSATSSPTRRRRPPPSRSTSCCSMPPGTTGRSSSPTPAPKPTSVRSSWPASSAGAAGTRWSAPWGASTVARLATLAATGQPAKHEPFAPMPEGFRHVAWGDLDAIRSAVDGSVAAVLIEPLQGEGGVIPAPVGYLRGIREMCDEVGALMMIDEIQTGFGRTGTWFGFEQHDAIPDVVTLAKAIGNGMPVGACWARRDVAAVFQPGDHGSTYSGTALATAAVSAVVDEMRRIDAPGSGAPARCSLHRTVGSDPAGRLGPWVGSPARRPTRRWHRRSHRLQAAARAWADLQRRQLVDTAIRPAAHGHRRRARACG